MPFFLPTDVARALGDPIKVTNRSLRADKYAEFAVSPEDESVRSRIVGTLTGGGFEEGAAASVRIKALSVQPFLPFRLRLAARMIVNHAGGVIENSGLALDRNSGVPYIPGSTVKGIAREGAHLCDAKPEEVALVFGWAANREQEEDLPSELPVKSFAGAVAFLPAYPPGSARLERDIATVHHPEYYSSPKKRPVALDDEHPVPNEFPVVAAGADFVFTLAPVCGARASAMKEQLRLRDFVALDRAKEWAVAGLTQHGAGAKTAAGYGWFEDPTAPAPGAEAKLCDADAFVEKWRGKDFRANRVVILREMAALKKDDDLKVVFDLVVPSDKRRRPLRTDSFWQSFASSTDGADVLRRLGVKLI